MSAVNFPQTEVQAPNHSQKYFYVDSDGLVECASWQNHSQDNRRLSAGNVYLSEDEAEQRKKWNAQEMARLVIPAWFRALGDDVQYLVGNGWARFSPESAKFIHNWSQEKPENYRAKAAAKAAPDVVVTVNGAEYRWPATAKQGDPAGDRFTAQVSFVQYSTLSCLQGNRTHLTRAGAEVQNAALLAALGGGL